MTIAESTGTWMALKNSSDLFIVCRKNADVKKNLFGYLPIRSRSVECKIYQSKPVSRILSWTIIYLGRTSPSGSRGTSCFNVEQDTALHPGKDLAVSPSDFTRGKPQAYFEDYSIPGTHNPFG